LRGALVYRWLTLAWAAAAFTWEVWYRQRSDDSDVVHPIVGFAMLGAALALTAWLTRLYRIDPLLMLKPTPVLTEIGVGTVMLLADTWVFGSADHAQTVPSVWVVGAVFAVAVAGGRRAAVTTGVGMGFARYVGLLLFVSSTRSTFSGLATMVLLGVSGWVAGYLLRRLAETDQSIASFRAREEVTRTLHDGVLQTLAVIQRRSDDAELVSLARSQERELRDFLFGTSSVVTNLAAGLRASARRAEQRYAMRVDVVTAPDLPPGTEPVIHGLTAAVGEALTNAAKHGRADGATVYAEPTEIGEIFVSVKDNGTGFDPATIQEGEGLRRSVRGRLVEVGGRVEIDGRLGRGAEIRMWV
jgi:signal transduction histidine kinase